MGVRIGVGRKIIGSCNRGESGLDEGSSSGDGDKWIDSGCFDGRIDSKIY